MPKPKSIYVCAVCGQQSLGWLGRCPACGAWNSFHQEVLNPEPQSTLMPQSQPEPLTAIRQHPLSRYQTGLGDLDRILGGGLVQGSVLLLGGEPGIGKSTLALQLLANLTGPADKPRLYISGEETNEALALRAQRLSITNPNIYLYAETNLQAIIQQIEHQKPGIVIVDSIQTIYHPNLLASPGSMSQVRSCAQELISRLKAQNITGILIGHITKFGTLAGPKTLEHLVDLVVYFEGERSGLYRLLRVVKNRYGPTSDLAVFQMTDQGLVPEDYSKLFVLSEHGETQPGRVLIPTLEGERALLIELEALSATSYFNYPQRICTGFDPKRLAMLLSILEHHLEINIGSRDIFVKTAYGLHLDDPAADLGIIAAVVSSYYKKPIARNRAILGEVALCGEIRRVLRVNLRAREAQRFGIQELIVPKSHLAELNRTESGIKLIGVENLKEALEVLELL